MRVKYSPSAKHTSKNHQKWLEMRPPGNYPNPLDSSYDGDVSRTTARIDFGTVP